MLFNSLLFVFAFLPLALAGWWLLSGTKLRLAFLTLASYVFYGWWDWRFVPLMFLSTSADYIAALRIQAATTPRARKAWLAGLLVFNLGLLAAFKYYDFLAGSWNGLGRLLGVHATLPLLNVILPIGISFYTFNSISYTIDVYRGKVAPTRNFIEFAAFVAMFPHLVAGPIVRYADMAGQFRNLREAPNREEIATGVWLFVIGMAKKVLVADIVADRFVAPVFDGPGGAHALGAWLGMAGFTLQLYFDMSGYSDMAVGLALFLGLKYPQNFNSPYKAANIADLWRRMHMTLTYFFRDYVYIPLGGSRGGALRTLRNLTIVVSLAGLWHGAGWTFALWGLYQGVLLAGYFVLKSRGWVPRSHALSVALTTLLFVLGWPLFRGASLEKAGELYSTMAGLRGIETLSSFWQQWGSLKLLWIVGGFAALWMLPNTWEQRYPRGAWAAVALGLLFVVCLTKFGDSVPFMYFQF